MSRRKGDRIKGRTISERVGDLVIEAREMSASFGDSRIRSGGKTWGWCVGRERPTEHGVPCLSVMHSSAPVHQTAEQALEAGRRWLEAMG